MDGTSNSTQFIDTFVNKTNYDRVWICPNLTSSQTINISEKIRGEIVPCDNDQPEFDTYANGTECSFEAIYSDVYAYVNTISTNFDVNIFSNDQELQLKSDVQDVDVQPDQSQYMEIWSNVNKINTFKYDFFW